MSSDQYTSSPEHDNDEHDHVYADNDVEEPLLDATPSQRLEHRNSLPEKVKALVDGATIETGGRCLITNTIPMAAVEYAHLLRRAATNSELTRLEYAWGLRWGTLNVDSRFNIFRLRADVHSLFDKGWLLLLPEREVVDDYVRNKKPDFGANRQTTIRYKYQLITTKDLAAYPIVRLHPPHPYLPEVCPEIELYSTHPHKDFPVLESHVHPCFVICHAGQFTELLNAYRSLGDEIFTRLATMISLYHTWMKASPDESFYEQLAANDDYSESNKTANHRLEEAPFRRNVRLRGSREQGSPSEGRGKKRRRSHGQYDTLQRLDLWACKANFSRPHPFKRRREVVQEWVSSVAEQTFVGDDGIGLQQTSHDKWAAVY